MTRSVETLTTGNQANLAYVSQEQRDALTSIFNSTTPWRQMTKANDVLNTINEEIKELQSAARNEAVALINDKFAAIKAIPAYAQIPENLRNQIDKFFSILSDSAKEERFIGNLKAMKSDIDCANEQLEELTRGESEVDGDVGSIKYTINQLERTINHTIQGIDEEGIEQ